MSLLRANGSTHGWRLLRAFVLRRDRNVCHWCGGYATHCDHVIPRIEGGTDALTNLVAACAPCNLARGRRLAAKRSRYRRQQSGARKVWAGAIHLEDR